MCLRVCVCVGGGGGEWVCVCECANAFYKRACFSGLEEVCVCA